MASIYLPKSTSELIQLGQKIVDRHKRLNAEDIEHGALINLNIEELNRKLIEIAPKFDELVKLREIAEQLNDYIKITCGTHGSNRKITPGTVRFIIAQVRDVLKGIHREDPKMLIEWGFDVIEKE